MIVVRIDLVSAIHPSRSRELGRMYITNDGVGTAERSDYDVAVCRRGTTTVPNPIDPLGPQPTRRGRVEGYPREAYNVWRLIARALLSTFPEEGRERGRTGALAERSAVAGMADGTADMYDELEQHDQAVALREFAKLLRRAK